MTNTNESGRSMVEMLGVLAIIGVLSVMGIAGYTQAMKKYKLNEALATASMGAVLCATGQKGTMPTSDYVTVTCNDDKTVKVETKDNVSQADLETALKTVGTVDGSHNFTMS